MNPISWQGLCETSRGSQTCHQFMIKCSGLALVWWSHLGNALLYQIRCSSVHQQKTQVCANSVCKFPEMRAIPRFACPTSQKMCAKLHSLWIQLCAEEHKGHRYLLHVSNTLAAPIPAGCCFYSTSFQFQQSSSFSWKLQLSVLWGALNPGLS